MTVYNNSRSPYLIDIPLPEDEPKPFSPFDTEDKKVIALHRAGIAPFSIWLMVCLFCRLIPEGLWMTLKFVAWYEMLLQTFFLSLSKLFLVEHSQHNVLNLFNHPIVLTPRVVSQHIIKFLKTFMKDDVYGIGLIPLLICMPIFLYSRYIFLRLLNIEMDKKYHETLQLILFLSFEKMYSVLMTFNQLSKKYSFLPQLARIISDPIVALVIIAILMNSEPSLEIVVFTLFFFYGVITIYYMEYDKEGAKMFCLTIFMFALIIFLHVGIVVYIDNNVDRDRESKAVVLYYNIPKNMCMPLQLTHCLNIFFEHYQT